MMIGEIRRAHPTVQIPPQWDSYDDPTANINSLSSPYSEFSPSAYAAALHSYLPSNYEPDAFDSDDSDSNLPFDSFSCDEFRMYEFKVRRCVRGRSHDWTECPYAHPGEKARRRDPRRYHYSGTPCPDFRKGACKKADACEFAHGVFECWLHPARYRTQPCKDGTLCKRRVCFFAHSPDQLRVDSTRPDSPPMSPTVRGMRGLQIGCAWGGPGPSTPTRIGAPTRLFDTWSVLPSEEELPMERVESGKNLRAAMYAKLRRENSLDRSEPVSAGPDFGWISELVK